MNAEVDALRAEVARAGAACADMQAEIVRLRAESNRLRELLTLPEHVSAQRIHHLQTSLKFLAEIARFFGFANRKQEMNEQFIGRVLREQAARVEQLEAALRGMLEWVEQNPKTHPFDAWNNARAALEGKRDA